MRPAAPWSFSRWGWKNKLLSLFLGGNKESLQVLLFLGSYLGGTQKVSIKSLARNPNKIREISFGGSKVTKRDDGKKRDPRQEVLCLDLKLARKNRAAFLLVIQVGCEDAPPFFF